MRYRALLFVLLATTFAFADNGVEIGNGKPTVGGDDKGGIELGNGSFENDVYKLKQIIGKWKIEFLDKFTEFRAAELNGIRTQAEIDMEKSLSILCLEDLIAASDTAEWRPVHVGNAYGVKQDKTSVSGIRKLKYRLFRAPGEIITVILSGPQGDKASEAFDNFQKTLESLEVKKS